MADLSPKEMRSLLLKEKEGILDPKAVLMLQTLRSQRKFPPPLRGEPVEEGQQVFPGQRSSLAEVRGASPAESEFGKFVLGDIVAPSVLPTVGAAAGAFTGPLAPVAIPALSLLGELANQKIGITQPSNLQLLFAGGIPAASQLLAGGTRAGSQIATRGRGAQFLNVIGAEEATAAAKKLRSPVAVNRLFEAARLSGSQIPMQKFISATDDVMRQAKILSAKAQKDLGPVVSRIQSIADDVVSAGGTFNPAKLQAELEAFADFTKSLRQTGGQGGRFADKALEALLSDLDTAAAAAAKNPSMAGARLLLEARKGFLRNQTVDEMLDAIGGALKLRRGAADAVQFNPTEVVKKMKANRFFSRAFSPEEQDSIFKLLKKINKIPVLPPPRGAEFGSGALLGRVARMAGIGVGAQQAGIPTEIAVGMAVVGPGTSRFFRDLVVALQFEEGRKILKPLLLNSDGAITPKIAGVIGAFAASRMAEQPSPSVDVTP